MSDVVRDAGQASRRLRLTLPPHAPKSVRGAGSHIPVDFGEIAAADDWHLPAAEIKAADRNLIVPRHQPDLSWPVYSNQSKSTGMAQAMPLPVA